MAMRDFDPLWDRKTYISIKENFKELFNYYIKSGLDAEEARVKAEQALADALLAKAAAEAAQESAEVTREEMLAIIREQTNGGDIVPEIVQARGGEDSLADRLNLIDQNIAQVKGQYVSYDMFKRGNLSDEEVIKAAHNYANERDLPVVSRSGEFWLKDPTDIKIKTNVDWGNTIFHIDESRNSNVKERFIVESEHEPFEIKLDEDTKSAVLSKLKPGVNYIPELASYKNCLVFIVDSNIQMGSRAGFDGQDGWDKEEFFFVEEGGRIIGDIAYEFDDYTSLVAYPADDNFLTISGGTFYLNGKTNPPMYNEYVNNGFRLKRSRVVFQNQWIGLDPDSDIDITSNPMYGFYAFDRAYDITFENIRVIPRLQDKGGAGANVMRGTYAFHGYRVLDVKMKNVTSEGSPRHWGTMAVDFIKDLKVENCKLNRVDAHYHGWNIYVKDSVIGMEISATGGGDLYIDNTVVHGTHFVRFRNDYGSKWDGDIRINRSKLKVDENAFVRLLHFSPSDYDYKYEITHGRTISIKDVVVDFSSVSTSQAAVEIIDFPEFGKFSHGGRIRFPNFIEFEHIRVTGRDKGIDRFFRLETPMDFHLEKEGGYDTVNKEMKPNCYMSFKNIQLNPLVVQDQSIQTNLSFPVMYTDQYIDNHSLYPDIYIDNCGSVSIFMGGAISNINVKNCRVINVDNYDKGGGRTAMTLVNCIIQSDITHRGSPAFYLDNEREQRVLYCLFDQPILNGQPNANAATSSYQYTQFFDMETGQVNFLNVGNRLSKRLTNVIGTGTKEFRQKLQNHNGYI